MVRPNSANSPPDPQILTGVLTSISALISRPKLPPLIRMPNDDFPTLADDSGTVFIRVLRGNIQVAGRGLHERRRRKANRSQTELRIMSYGQRPSKVVL